MKTILGSELIGASFGIKGKLTPQEGIRLLRRVITRIGMRPWGDPIVRHWPGEAGVGGHGVTIIQSLVESFAVIETWEELDGFYLVIHSCRPFDPYAVWWFINQVGYEVVSIDGCRTVLDRPKSLVRRILDWIGGK